MAVKMRIIKKTRSQKSCYRKGDTYSLPVEMEIDTATIENSTKFLKTKIELSYNTAIPLGGMYPPN